MVNQTRVLTIPRANRIAAFIFVLACLFLGLFVYQSWQSERAAHVREMRSVMEMGEKSINVLFSQFEADLRHLALDWLDRPEPFDHQRAYQDLRRFVELRKLLINASVLGLDGQVWFSHLLAPGTNLPSARNEASFQEYQSVMLSSPDFRIGRVVYTPTTHLWVIPLRLLVRDKQGQPRFILVAQLPVTFLSTFWKEAPIAAHSSIALLRDDAYLLNRFPAPAQTDFQELYGKPRNGALVRYLKEHNFPKKGSTEGFSSLLGTEVVNVFQRLHDYPLTLTVVTERRHIIQAWWQRVNVAIILAISLMMTALLSYWYLHQRHLKWRAEEQKLARIQSEFISVVSHELRTPITSIRGSLGLLQSGKLGGFSAEAGKLIQIAHNNSVRLSKLVNDILDMEKLSLGKVRLNFQRVDLRQLALQAAESISGYANKMNVQTRFEVPNQACWVNADGERLIQVMLNLLSNAAKFSAAGQTVVFRLSLQAQVYRVEVEDFGKGIPEEFKAKIFEAFSQEDTTTTRSQEGTGLGLHICKILIERMGGEIGFESQLGRGSCFWFALDALLED